MKPETFVRCHENLRIALDFAVRDWLRERGLPEKDLTVRVRNGKVTEGGESEDNRPIVMLSIKRWQSIFKNPPHNEDFFALIQQEAEEFAREKNLSEAISINVDCENPATLDTETDFKCPGGAPSQDKLENASVLIIFIWLTLCPSQRKRTPAFAKERA